MLLDLSNKKALIIDVANQKSLARSDAGYSIMDFGEKGRRKSDVQQRGKTLFLDVH